MKVRILKKQPTKFDDFKVGMRAIYTSGDYLDSSSNPLWNGHYGQIVGTITILEPDSSTISIMWDNNHTNIYRPGDLTIVSARKGTSMFVPGELGEPARKKCYLPKRIIEVATTQSLLKEEIGSVWLLFGKKKIEGALKVDNKGGGCEDLNRLSPAELAYSFSVIAEEGQEVFGYLIVRYSIDLDQRDHAARRFIEKNFRKTPALPIYMITHIDKIAWTINKRGTIKRHFVEGK